MRRVLRLARGDDRSGGRVALIVDLRSQLARVRFARQLRLRNVHERRIAELVVSVEKGALVRLGEAVRPLRAAEWGGRVVRLENVQRFRHRDAAGRCGRHREDRVAAILAPHRRAPLGLIVREILERDDAAAALHFRDERIGDRAVIEAVGAARGDLAQRPRKLRLHEPRAGRNDLDPFGKKSRLPSNCSNARACCR